MVQILKHQLISKINTRTNYRIINFYKVLLTESQLTELKKIIKEKEIRD